jgi:hypothetical protein
MQSAYIQTNKPKTIPKYDPNKKYVLFYVGDYDAASWTVMVGTTRWTDTKRGKIPLAWGFNPNLSDRIPVAFDYFYKSATDSDYFVAGASGAGYVFPSMLLKSYRTHSGLPDGLNAWATWCKKYYNRFDISISCNVTNIVNNSVGFSPSKVELNIYNQFSPNGLTSWSGPNNDEGFELVNGLVHTGMPNEFCLAPPLKTAQEYYDSMTKAIKTSKRTLKFYLFRCNLVQPTELFKAAQMAIKADPNIVIVDPYTFYGMIKNQIS